MGNNTVETVDKTRASIYLIKVLCMGLISAILLTGCNGHGSASLEEYFTNNPSAKDSMVQEINGQFESTGAKSKVEIEDNDIIVTIDITDLAKEQGIEKTNKNEKVMKEEFDKAFSDKETSFCNSLTGLADKVHSCSVTMKIKIVWDGDTIFSDSFKGEATEKK